MFEPLPDINAESNEHNPLLPVGISNINVTSSNTIKNEDIKNIKRHLSLNTKELIDRQKIILSVQLY